MKTLLKNIANRIMEYQLEFHFAVTTKLESYTEFNIVPLKISCCFCSSLHPVTAEPVRSQSVSWLTKKMFYEKIIYGNINLNAAPASVPFREKMLQDLRLR